MGVLSLKLPVGGMKKRRFVEELISSRKDGEFILSLPENVDYVDVAPSQIASVAASMIPFLEHDDANRALMGSNMQRQAVPCIKPERPLVGTGMERKVAVDSGASCILTRRAGVVSYVDAGRIAVRTSGDDGDIGVDIYDLVRHTRSNQNTNVNHRPIVREGEKIDKVMLLPTVRVVMSVIWPWGRICWLLSCLGTVITLKILF